MRRTQTALRRSEAARARLDTGTRVSERRARTRRLIERGGLLAKSGLEQAIAAHPLDPEREANIAAILLGALLELTDAVRGGGDGPQARARLAAWQLRGRAALRAGPTSGTAATAAEDASVRGGSA